jgi:hypothetical protein
MVRLESMEEEAEEEAERVLLGMEILRKLAAVVAVMVVLGAVCT